MDERLSVERQRRSLIESLGHRPRNRRRRRKQSAESAIQLAGQSTAHWQWIALSALALIWMTSNLGRCPRLPLTCAFGA